MAYDRTRPNLTENNRVYLYRLLKESIGCGKQTFITSVEEALAADGVAPKEIGYADTRELLEALDSFVKLTVFKGGRVYATLSAVPAWDEALSQPEKAAAKDAGAKGKSWKKKKGAKALKPQRPKRIKREEPKAKVEPEPAGKAQNDSDKETSNPSDQAADGAQLSAEDVENQAASAATETPHREPEQNAKDDSKDVAAATETVNAAKNADNGNSGKNASGTVEATMGTQAIDGATESEAKDVAQKPSGAPKTLKELLAAISEADDSDNNQTAEAGETTGQADETAQSVKPAKAESPGAPSQPALSSVHATDTQAASTSTEAKTAVQTNAAASQTDSTTVENDAPSAQSATGPASSETAAEPQTATHAAAAEPPAMSQEQPASATPTFDFKDYPVDFSREVFCPGDLLAELSALLPWGADALGIAGEYYWIARERNTIEATRSRASFTLRYTRDGKRHEATVTIKRKSSRDGAAWAIDSISNENENV